MLCAFVSACVAGNYELPRAPQQQSFRIRNLWVGPGKSYDVIVVNQKVNCSIEAFQRQVTKTRETGSSYSDVTVLCTATGSFVDDRGPPPLTKHLLGGQRYGDYTISDSTAGFLTVLIHRKYTRRKPKSLLYVPTGKTGNKKLFIDIHILQH